VTRSAPSAAKRAANAEPLREKAAPEASIAASPAPVPAPSPQSATAQAEAAPPPVDAARSASVTADSAPPGQTEATAPTAAASRAARSSAASLSAQGAAAPKRSAALAVALPPALRDSLANEPERWQWRVAGAAAAHRPTSPTPLAPLTPPWQAWLARALAAPLATEAGDPPAANAPAIALLHDGAPALVLTLVDETRLRIEQSGEPARTAALDAAAAAEFRRLLSAVPR
jgi:hypothetical protein